MNKLLKILFIGVLLFTFCFTFSYATEENSEETETSTNEVIEETPTTGLSTLTSDNDVTSISSLNSYSQANLELNNILCIILIAVGVVIILLAIAILIRTKK